jgi:hypothetical protein
VIETELSVKRVPSAFLRVAINVEVPSAAILVVELLKLRLTDFKIAGVGEGLTLGEGTVEPEFTVVDEEVSVTGVSRHPGRNVIENSKPLQNGARDKEPAELLTLFHII